MLAHKRKRNSAPSQTDSDPDLSSTDDFSDDEVDISSALTGKRPKLAPPTQPFDNSDDDEEDLEDIIRMATSKANVKGGTEMLKKTKGKAKIAKGEVGGGSFQSMGAFNFDDALLTL